MDVWESEGVFRAIGGSLRLNEKASNGIDGFHVSSKYKCGAAAMVAG